MPWKPFRKSLDVQLLVMLITYWVIWGIGILGFTLGTKQLQNHLSKRKQAEEALQESAARRRRAANGG
ncbi:MAG TPA: hypothetical protein VJZ49_12490 [Syntrophales bacterium]|nr:hypothetical protein [Syntrophales bacterium]